MNLKKYLDKLSEQGFLKQEEIGFNQVRALLDSAFKNIKASRKNLSIDEETCYTMAYNAMIKIARALIFLQGFRPDDGQQHKTTIEVAGEILGESFKNLINKFDKMRQKRNRFIYDPAIPPSQEEANNAIKVAEEFYNKTKTFLEETNPQLKLFK